MAITEAKPEISVGERVGKCTTTFSSFAVKNILFATDFSATSEAALPYAAAICRRFGSTLHAAHVLSDTSLVMTTGGVDYVSLGTIYDDAQDEARERLNQISDRLDGIPQRNYVRHGQVWKNLAAIIEQNDVDLIVVGTHGRTGLGKLLLGSVAEDILRHAGCPVVTVGPRVSGRARLPALDDGGRDLAPPDLDLRNIVFATNFAKSAERLMQASVALANDFHARLTLMHVIEDYTRLGSDPGPIEECTRKLKELIPANSVLQHLPETVIEFGHVRERILKVADEREADLIVLGARASAEVGTTHLLGSAATEVIAYSHCPVLTIRQ